MEFFLQLSEDLQCPICYECVVPPVQTCLNGHIVCGVCSTQITRCALCRETLTNFAFVDRLLLQKKVVPCKNSDVKTATVFLQLPKDLQCPICCGCAFPPIQTCTNGHIICGVCFDNTETCATCQAQFFPIVYMDRILNEKNIHLPCRNWKHGCHKQIKAAEMKDHVRICGHRPIACWFLGMDNCSAQSISLNNFVSHVESFHKIRVTESNEGLLNVNIPYSFLTSHSPERIELFILNFDENIFFICKLFERQKHYFIIGLFGDSETSNRYYCRYTTENLKKNQSNGTNETEIQMVAQTWKLKVLPLKDRKFLTFTSENEMPRVEAISKHQFFLEHPVFKSSMHFEWKINFEIGKSK